MRAILSPDDLKRGDLVTPTWHPCEIVDYTEKEAKTDQSTNCVFHFKILEGPDKGGVLQTLFNEKALGFGKNLYAAVGLPKNAAGGYDLDSDVFKKFIGRKVSVYVKRGKGTNGEFNDVSDYKELA